MSDLPPVPPDLPEAMPEEPTPPPESTAPSQPTSPVAPVSAGPEPATAPVVPPPSAAPLPTARTIPGPAPLPSAAPPPGLEPYQTAPLTPPAERRQAQANAALSGLPQPFGPERCPRCGGQDFATGQLLSYGGRFRPAYYKPRRLSFFRLNNLLRPFRALAEVEAQVCRSCGLVLCQVDTERLARIERR